MNEKFECSFCHIPFKSEKRLENHNCKKKKRFEEIHTARGQAAWQLYCEWFRIKKIKVPEQESFLQSRFYNSFISFSDFIKEMSINDSSLYMQYMVKKDYPPIMWCNRHLFGEYLKLCLINIPPMDQVSITVDWLDKYAGKMECCITDVIEKLESYQIMDGIRSARFLPWYFLHSPKFSKKIKQFNKDLQNDFMITIDVVYWTHILEKNIQLREEIRQIIKQIET